MRHLRNLTLGTKILLLGIGGVLLTVIALTAAAAWQSGQFNDVAHEQVKQLIDADLEHIVGGVYNLVKAQDEAVQQQVNTSLNVARLVFNTEGNISLGKDSIQWTAVNQYTHESSLVTLPKMLVGGSWLGQNTYPSVTTLVVDQIQYLVGGTATIFQRMNDQGDMLRVATNIKNADGQRAIGNYIPATGPDGKPDPVIAAILRGETYRGSAYVVNAWYNAAYEPIRSESGLLVGMLFVGIKQENVTSLREAIRQTTVGTTGYAFILGSDGDDLGKYIIAEKGRRDGENLWNYQDAQGDYIIRNIIQNAQALAPGATDKWEYQWQNPDEPAPREKIARIAYYEPWHWVLVASAYKDDFDAYGQALETAQANLRNASGVIGLIAALIVGLISLIFARSISRPIGALATAATQIASGNLNVSTPVNRQDEIGTLAKAFNAMATQVRDLIGSLEQRVTARTLEVAQRSDEVALRSTQLETLNAQLQASNRNAERRATQLAISAQVSRAISQVRDLDQLLSQVTRLIGEAFSLYHVGIFIVDEANRYAVLHATNSEGGQRMLARNHKLAVGHQGMVGYVTQTGLPRIALDAGADAVHFNNPDLPDTRSEMTLPLQVSGRILGALDLQTTEPAAFSDEDLTVLSTLADQVAVAIDNARLFTRTLAALQETEKANKQHLREQWQRLLPTLRQTSHEYHLSGVLAVGDAPLPEIEQVLRRGEVVIASDGDGSGLTPRTALAVPIKLRDQVIGVIDLHETDADRRWTDDDVAVVLAVADQAALSLENARLLDETERSAQRERAINEINSRVRQTIDLDSILQTAVNELGQALGAARVTARIGRKMPPPAHLRQMKTATGKVIIMVKTIRHLLAPPVFEQEEQNRVASLLTRLLQIMFVTFTLLLVISEIVTPSPGFTYPALAISTTSLVTIYALLHRGRLRQASLLVVGFMWLLFTGVSALFMGVLGYFPAGYVLCIVLAGANFGRKGVLIMTGVSILSTLGIFLAETTGLIHPFRYPGSGLVDLLDWAFLLALISVFVLSTEDYLRAALVNARHNEQAQLVANRELTAIRESLEERVAARTAQLQISAEVSRAVSSFLDEDELVSQVVNLITQRFHFHYAAIFLMDTAGEYAVLREATGEAGQKLKERGHMLEITGQSLVTVAIRAREPRAAKDVDKETLRFANPLLTDTRSEVALPLMVGNRVLGALDVQSRQANAFDESTVAMLSGLANQIAITLNTAQSYQTARADAQVATALFEASQATGFLGEDLLAAVNRLFGVVAQRSDFDTWLAARYDPGEEAYTILTAFDANEPAPLEDTGQTFKIDRVAATPATLAILTREAVVIDDPDRDARLSGLSEDIRLTLGKFVSAPAILGDRVLGAIVLGRTRNAPGIGARDIQLAQALASQLAMTIANRELFDQAQTAAAELKQMMRLYTRQGWEDYTQATAMIEHEYQRPDAAPIGPAVIPHVEDTARAGQLESAAFDGQAVFDVPITLRGEVLGTLQVQDHPDRKWTDDELATLQAVSDQVAQSIEAARLLAQSESSLLETTTLYEVSRALATAPTLTDALQLFVKTIHQRLKADQVALVLFDDERGYGTVEAEAVPTLDGPTVRLPMQGNPSYEVLLQTLRSITVYDIAHDPITANTEVLIARGVKSMLLVPLVVGQRLVGSFGVDSNQTQRRFTGQEITFCETLARQAAGTIERYQLFEQTQTSLEETRALYQASRGIAAAQTSDDILRAVSDSIAAPHIDRVLLALHDPDSPPTSPALDIAAVWERNVEVSSLLNDRWTASRIPLIARTLTEPLALNDVEQAPEIDPLSRRILATVVGMKAAVIVPLLAGGRTLGWIVIESLKGPHAFGEQEVRRYRTLAGQATVALENRRLFQDVEARVNELTVLTRISRRLASTLELDEVLSLIVDESINATQARQASIALYNEAENALEVRVMRGYTPEMEQAALGTLIRPGQGLHGRLLTTGRAVLVADVKLDTEYRAVNTDTRSEFIVPIRQGDLLLGALNLESPKPHAFADTDVRLIEALADQVAVAITNARAYEAERQAVERMREVDRLKTQFLANMSHELRTPLNSIIGFSRVILRGIDGPISELQQTDLTSIYNSGQHLLSLINNILDLSKIEAGKMELSIEPLDLRDIAKSVMSTAIALVKDKVVRLNQEVPDDLPTVMADQTRVRQIMLNLVSNAAKFTEQGSITLRVKAYPKELYISVTDTGIGVADDKREHIFEEFTQADASTTRRYGGTGLGLAITKKFVEMHKGRIWIESQVGVGSTFTFTLPREQVIEEPEPLVSLPTDLEARGEGKKLVMCIDDDPGVITLYKRYLEKQGYQVIGLTDSSKAVDEARRLLPFAITLDVLMPNRDGWDVLADLKKTPEISNTPIVLCSIIHDKSKGFSLGAADYLVKPITEGELLGALERVRRNTAVRRVLVVDDEPDALNLLKRLLEAEPNYEVITAPGGAEALAAVQTDKPDLMILDLMMPDIDGFAVLDNLKSSTLTRHIPVIIVTAKELTADDRARLQGKTVALFNKGMFTADQLMTDIVAALQTMNGASVTVLAA